MNRALLTAVSATLVMSSSANAQSSQDWKRSVDFGDWTFLLGDEDVALLYRAPTVTPRRVWIRSESRVPEGGARSTVALYEVDCSGRRSRPLQTTRYTRTNMIDPTSTTATGEWRFAVPGTFHEAIIDLMCPKPNP